MANSRPLGAGYAMAQPNQKTLYYVGRNKNQSRRFRWKR